MLVVSDLEGSNPTGVGQAALTLRTITNGSEHMFKRALEMHIGSILPISSPLKMITLIPIVPEKMKRQKSFGHLSSP